MLMIIFKANFIAHLFLHVILGFMLIGSDVKLNSPSSLISQALAEILQYPDKARDALRVLLHLVRDAQSIIALECAVNHNITA